MEILKQVEATRQDGQFKRAWENYREIIRGAAEGYVRPRVLEIGGGRLPSFSRDEVERLDASYTVNDIDADELALAPAWVDKLHGDIASSSLLEGHEHTDRYDLIFSHMVFEHVADPDQGYANIARLLAPGGTLINFVPTLYAVPFVINRAIPERAARELLRRTFPDRDLSKAPKFPAYYRWCASTERVRRKIEGQGFRRTSIVPFYGHDYFVKIPPLQKLENVWSRVASKASLRVASTYAFILCEGERTGRSDAPK